MLPSTNWESPPWSADTSCPFQQELHGQLPEARGPRAASPSLPGSPALPSMCVWLVRAGVLARRYLVLELAKVVERTLVQRTMLQGDHGRRHQRVVVGNTAQARIQLFQAGWSLLFSHYRTGSNSIMSPVESSVQLLGMAPLPSQIIRNAWIRKE